VSKDAGSVTAQCNRPRQRQTLHQVVPFHSMFRIQQCCSLPQMHSADGRQEAMPIDKQPAYLLGRQADVVDIPLEETSCSREHAALVHHADGRLFLIDLASVRLLPQLVLDLIVIA